MIKTGIGYDVHQLAEGEKLIIGGVEIPSQVGAIAVSYTHLTLPTSDLV